MATVFDIEGNDFYPAVKHVWCLCTEDTDTGEKRSFSNYDKDLPSLEEGLEFLSKQKILVGHNITGYDLVVLDKLCNWRPDPDVIIYDTWILSQTTRYKRNHKHGLEGWGGSLGYPKINFDKFDQYSKEMLTYCERDVSLNVKVYKKLVEEIKSTIKINKLFKVGMTVENEFSVIEADIRTYGWNFNESRANELVEEMRFRLEQIENEIEPQIGLVCCKKDPADEYKVPLIKKNGEYAASTCKYFGIDPVNALEERLVDGPYCRVEFVPGKLSSDRVLKQWLYSLGWEPDEWNTERINGKFVNKSPKLTESSLEPLGAIGKAISEYNSLANRHGILKGWLKEIEYDGRLHGRMWTIGTPTFRCRHEVIANLPSVEVAYGKEMRGLLLPREGWVLVGADSAGNQMRGLCHFIGNDEFTKEVIHGDVHTKNAEILDEFFLRNENAKSKRGRAKRFLYAYLFGAGAGKVALILVDRRDAELGKQAIAKFVNAIPGLKELKEDLERQFNMTKDRFGEDYAFIRGIDGRIIFTKSKHQVLNYLLQTTEGITCKAAAVYFKRKMREELSHIPYKFLLHYHDEMCVECPPEHAEQVAAVMKESFREAPKWFGVECMDGDAKIGYNYAEVH